MEDRDEDRDPSDDRTTIAQHFGRTSGFMVFDYDGATLTSDYRPIASVAAASCCGGDGASRHDLILAALHDCDVVIAGGMGGGMMTALEEAGIEIALSTVTDVGLAAQMLIDEVLPQSGCSECCSH